MFKHSCMLQSTINSNIIPLVNNKCGNLGDKNNIMPIALSSITSKVFEHTILLRLEEYLWTTENQFCFKSDHSTDFCILCTMPLRNFRYCSNEVECSLLKPLCTNMYCCPPWFNSTSSSVKK